MDQETSGEEMDSHESSSDDEPPCKRMRAVSPAQLLPQPSSDSMEEAEPDGLHSGAGALVPSTSTAGAAPDREPLTVQRASPLQAPVSYSAARLRTERGVVELPAPPANIRMEASGEMSGHMTGVSYDMSNQYIYNVDRAVFTRRAVREMARQRRLGSRPAIQSGSSSGTVAEAVARMLMPGQSVPAMSDLGPAIHAGEGADCTLPSALLDCKIRAMKEDFVETDFFQSLERRLLDQGVAVVVGPTGEGKSSNAIMMCHRLRDEGYLSTYFEFLDELDTESIARCKRNLFVVIDNVFGTSILDAANLDRWSRVLSNLIAVQTAGRQGGGQGARKEGGSCGKKSLLLLLLSRDNVFSEAVDKASNLPCILRDQASRVVMKSADYLHMEEKREFLKKCADKTGRDMTEKEESDIFACRVPIGFPQVCHLYHELKAFHDKPVEFFSKPTSLLLETLREMMRKDAMVRAALALLVLQGGSVPLQSLQLPEKREACGINAALQIIRKKLGHPEREDEDCQELLKTFKTLCEGLLTQERGRVSFSHDSVRDAVCVALADRSLPFVAEHCSLAVLSQCILLDDSSTTFFCQILNQSVLAVPKGQWHLFTKRLVSELEKGKFRDVFTCNLMSNPEFCSELAALCLKSKLVSDIVHRVDVDCGLNFLFWASLASTQFLADLLTSCQFNDTGLWQGIIGSCIRGRSELIKLMHRSLVRKSLDDWSVPISVWFGKHEAEGDAGGRSETRWRRTSTRCRWGDLPVGRHAIPGTVAAQHGHVSVLETLVELGMPADVRDPQQCTPLMSACSGGQKDPVAFLVTSHKADLTAADSRGSTPLHKLAEGGHDDIACWLVETHMDDHVLNAYMNKTNAELQTPVMLACRHATKLAGLLLAKGAETGTEDKQKKSCLHYAAEAGESGLMEKLLDLKTMDVKQVSRSGWSPLHFACSRPNNLESVKMLLRHGAEVKPRDKNSTETPVHVAMRQGCLEIVQALVESSSDVLAVCESVNTTSPFLLACEKGNVEVVRYLHGRKADVSKQGCLGSALHYAARSGNVDTVQYVMTNTDLHVDLRSNAGQTPLRVACAYGRVEVVKYLIKKKADISGVDNDGDTALHNAAFSGNVDTVQYLLDETDVSFNARNKSGKTPLLKACVNGQIDVVKYLRERKADISDVDSAGNTALHWAAWSGNVDTVQYVMDECGVDVEARNKCGETPLLLACQNGRVEVVKYLREREADISGVDSDGDTALHCAAWSGNADTVQYIMDECGVDVEARNKSRQTPLLVACQNGRVEVVKYLREREVDISGVDSAGNTALHWAACSGNVDTVQYVMDECGVDVEARNKCGETPLLRACQNGRVEVVKYLREREADISGIDSDGNSALHLAAWSGNVDTVQYIMDESGVDVEARNKSGQTPLLLACANGQIDVVKYLRERKADISGVDSDGDTALHLAAWSGNVDTVQYVMDECGVDVEARNKYGQTPLLQACGKGRVEAVKYLRQREADVSVVDENGNTALHWAAHSGDMDTVHYLVEDSGMNVVRKNSRQETPLSIARGANHAAVMHFLSEKVQHLGDQVEPGEETRERRKP